MILVFGSSGTVGKEVVKELANASERVRAAYHSRPPSLPGVEGARVDLATGEGLKSALSGVDTVFILTGSMEDQTAAELRAVEAARAAGVKRIVKLSVWEADKESYSFARIHRPVERSIEESGIAWTHLRPNSFMQNFVTYETDSIRTQGTLRIPCGEARIAHIDARDIARVAALALTAPGHEGKAYELSGPEALTYAEAVAILSDAAAKKITYVSISEEEFRQASLNAGLPEALVEQLADLYAYYLAGGAAQVTTAVRDATGRDPTTFAAFAGENGAALR